LAHQKVISQSYQGRKPKRPDDAETIRKGLDEGLWLLLNRCWNNDPEKRPLIDEVIMELEYLFEAYP
jgi:hypothetical protein